MSKPVVLVTGANGEIGRSLLQTVAAHGGFDVVTLDLTLPPDALRSLVVASYAGNIMDRYLLDQVAAHHEVDMVFHLAALLSTRGERDPELAHQVNVEGTLNVLRMAQNQSARLGRPVRFIFPSSIAVYGLPSLEEKRAVGRVREEQWNVPITMYGCNKLYCEHVGRYFTLHARAARLGARRRAHRLPLDPLPRAHLGRHGAHGGTSDFGPGMIHAAASGTPYSCFVRPDARIPFMAMPDAVRALLDLARADRERLTTCVYNIGAFSLSAAQIADRVKKSFPAARIDYEPDPARTAIVASWPEDVDDARARADWGWQPRYPWDRAFDEYLVPNITARYAVRRRASPSAARIEAGQRRGPPRRAVDEDVDEPPVGARRLVAPLGEDADLVARRSCDRGARRGARVDHGGKAMRPRYAQCDSTQRPMDSPRAMSRPPSSMREIRWPGTRTRLADRRRPRRADVEAPVLDEVAVDDGVEVRVVDDVVDVPVDVVVHPARRDGQEVRIVARAAGASASVGMAVTGRSPVRERAAEERRASRPRRRASARCRRGASARSRRAPARRGRPRRSRRRETPLGTPASRINSTTPARQARARRRAAPRRARRRRAPPPPRGAAPATSRAVARKTLGALTTTEMPCGTIASCCG